MSDRKEPRAAPDTLDLEAVRSALKAQYHAALAMLKETIQGYPQDAWSSDEHLNAPWQIAYHTLFFTHLYLQPNDAAFRPWGGHQEDVQHPDGLSGPPHPDSTLPLLPRPYTKAEVLEYWSDCDEMVDGAVDHLDLHSPESGFYWYKVPKLEHQLINLRHLQHGAAQLADRVRAAANAPTRWVGTMAAGSSP
jgi:hypothetical protein